MARELIRINTRISVDLNEWLDSESKETGLPKSTIILMALENFRREKQVMKGMADMGQLYAKLESLEQKIGK